MKNDEKSWSPTNYQNKGIITNSYELIKNLQDFNEDMNQKFIGQENARRNVNLAKQSFIRFIIDMKIFTQIE